MKINDQYNLSMKRTSWGQLGSNDKAPANYCEYDNHLSFGEMPKVQTDVMKADAGKKGSGVSNDGTIDRAAKNKAEKY